LGQGQHPARLAERITRVRSASWASRRRLNRVFPTFAASRGSQHQPEKVGFSVTYCDICPGVHFFRPLSPYPLDGCPMFPRISCGVCWIQGTPAAFLTESRTRGRRATRAGNSGRTSVHGPKTISSNAFAPFAGCSRGNDPFPAEQNRSKELRPVIFVPRTRISCHGAQPTSACAAFIKESGMRFAERQPTRQEIRGTPMRTWGTRPAGWVLLFLPRQVPRLWKLRPSFGHGV
jgi:hypothetical protein